MDKIKIVVITHDIPWFERSAKFLGNEPDFSMVGIASNKSKAMKLMRKQAVDLVLLDLNLGKDCESISIIKELTQIKAINVIVVTADQNEPLMAQMLLAGAIDYCLKENFQGITLFNSPNSPA